MSTPRSRPLIAVAALGLLAAACGNDDGTGTDARPEQTAPAGAQAAERAPHPSPGCDADDTEELAGLDAERQTIDVDGEERWYLLNTPEAHDGETPLPLVVSFHGLSEGADVHQVMTSYGELGREEGFVTAHPHGSGEPVRWDLRLDDGTTPDLEFVDAMLDDLGERLCLDERRVYASGLSYGAMMTSFLLCQRADRFAAAAPVAGLAPPGDPCDRERAVPLVTFHGTHDEILLFDGSVGDLSGFTDLDPPDPESTTTTLEPDLHGEGYPTVVAEWAERNGCDTEPVDEPVGDEVIHRTYDCPAGADVEFYIVQGGGHTWPGSEFSAGIEDIVGHTTFDVIASETAWEFFQRFALPD